MGIVWGKMGKMCGKCWCENMGKILICWRITRPHKNIYIYPASVDPKGVHEFVDILTPPFYLAQVDGCWYPLTWLRVSFYCVLARLASLAQFTHRQAPSVHRLRYSLIQRFRETLHAQNHSHTQTGAICPLLALLAHSELSGDTACAETHTQAGAICPIACVARSFSAR